MRRDDFSETYESMGLDEKPANGSVPQTFTAAQLMDETLPEVAWAVPDILPEGTMILAGKPKMGKSWMVLGLCLAVASGGCALGTKNAKQGSTLYLALEDNKRRLQNRMRKVLQGKSAPEELHMRTEWPRMGEGGIEALDGWLRDHPDCRLVVVDTLARFKPQSAGRRTQYDEDRNAVDPLIPLAAEHGVTILLVHHLREMESDDPLDMIHGGAGLTGGVDGALVLKRKRGRADAFLHIDGRDLENPAELALKWDSSAASWTIIGDAEEYRMGERRAAIQRILENADEPLGPQDITDTLNAKDIDAKYGAVREMLSKMVTAGQAKNIGRGKYVPPDASSENADNADNLTNQ